MSLFYEEMNVKARVNLQKYFTLAEISALLGVSTKALDDPKTGSTRFRRLSEVVTYINKTIGGGQQSRELLRDILNNGRVPFDGVGDDSSMSLISYICAYPEDGGWCANADAAFKDWSF